MISWDINKFEDFRKNHNIMVHVMQTDKSGFDIDSEVHDYNPDIPYYYSYCLVNTLTAKWIGRDGDCKGEQYYGGDFDTFEDAMAAGLVAAELLINHGKTNATDSLLTLRSKLKNAIRTVYNDACSSGKSGFELKELLELTGFSAEDIKESIVEEMMVYGLKKSLVVTDTTVNWTPAEPGWYQANNSKQFHYFLHNIPICKKRIKGFNEYIKPYGNKMDTDSPNYYNGYCQSCINKLPIIENKNG